MWPNVMPSPTAFGDFAESRVEASEVLRNAAIPLLVGL